jgi:transglutaminase-like putative cysteine protease
LNLKNKTLYISLFATEAVSAFILLNFLFDNNILIFAVIALLGISLLLSWFFASKYEKNMRYLGYAVMLAGLFLSISYFKAYYSSTGILTVAVSIIIGINLALRERKMLIYLLIFSFMLFLYGSSVVYNTYSIYTIAIFTFSFFTVVVSNYYHKQVNLQSDYVSNSSNHFFSTTLLLVIVAAGFTGILYYLLPQPKAIHYGILPFGGPKQYKGKAGEGNKDSKYHKTKTTQLTIYTADGKIKKQKSDFLYFTQHKKKKKNSNTLTEKYLKKENKKAYYSSLYVENSQNNLNPILFKVYGREARFLRGKTYEEFDGFKWNKIVHHMFTIDANNRYYYFDGKSWQKKVKILSTNTLYYNEYFTQKTDNYTITVKGKLSGRPIIFIPIGTLMLQFPTNLFYEDNARTIYAPSQLQIDTFYTASAQKEGYYGYDTIIYKDVWYKKLYSQVYPNIDKNIVKLAKKITKNEHNAFEKAQAIVHYFKANYLYKNIAITHKIHSQTLKTMLFDTKVGNALQFNTALVVMLRISGEYARIATGYAPDRYDTKTKSYLVQRKNKAVWSEVFVANRGWVAIHASDDIPFEGEILENDSDIKLSNTQIALLIALLSMIITIIIYFARAYVWTYLSKYRIKRYYLEDDIDFVKKSYTEIQKYYTLFQKGKKDSCTLQEYKLYLQEIKPQSSYPIEYLIFYSNEAFYNAKLDLDFNKDRFLEISLYLVDHPFKR